MDYSEQYKHPKWQKRRLDYMNYVIEKGGVDTPLCEWCFDTETQLHLHHKMYHKKRKVWEYKDNELLLLCKNCHEDIHNYKEYIDYLLGFYSNSIDALEEITMILYRLSAANVNALSTVNKYIKNKQKRQDQKVKANG